MLSYSCVPVSNAEHAFFPHLNQAQHEIATSPLQNATEVDAESLSPKKWCHIGCVRAPAEGRLLRFTHRCTTKQFLLCIISDIIYYTFTEKWYLIWKCVWLNRNTTTIAVAAAVAALLNGIRIKWGEIALTICRMQRESETGAAELRTKWGGTIYGHHNYYSFFILYEFRQTINFHWIFIQSKTISSPYVGKCTFILCLRGKTVK